MRNFLARTFLRAIALACCLTGAVAADDTLTAIHGSMDELRALPSAFGSTRQPFKIAVLPIGISYARQRHDTQPYYRESDFQLRPEEIGILQKAVAEAFATTWFNPQQWQLVSDPAQADAHLVLEFREFWLAAPLRENIRVATTYTGESARFTLHGRIERAGSGQHLLEFTDRRRLRQPGVPPTQVDRFNMVTFWRDMRLDLESVASQLNRLVTSGKNDQKS